MSKILVGTASWADKHLVDCGKYYPPEVKTAEERLRYYAADFPMVEVDSSYYGLPTPSMVSAWAERTPPGFVFNLKAFRLFTGHQTPPKVLPKELRQPFGSKNLYYKDLPEELRQELWARMREVVQPLREAGKFGAWHFQFAPWLAFHPENFAHIEECRRQLPDDLIAVEFRNPSWFTERHRRRTLDFQRDLGLAHVVVDAPQEVKFTVPAVWEVTQPRLAVVRLHGRNRETWNKPGLTHSSQRFNYDYSQAELQELVEPIEALSRQAAQVDVIFNNNYEDQGQRNGKQLRLLLAGE